MAKFSHNFTELSIIPGKFGKSNPRFYLSFPNQSIAVSGVYLVSL